MKFALIFAVAAAGFLVGCSCVPNPKTGQTNTSAVKSKPPLSCLDQSLDTRPAICVAGECPEGRRRVFWDTGCRCYPEQGGGQICQRCCI